MSTLLASAPALDEKRLDQIAALPLGGRIKVDPWTDQVELSKAKPVLTENFPRARRWNSNSRRSSLTSLG